MDLNGRREKTLPLKKEYPKEHENYNELQFLMERVRVGRVEILVPNLKDKKGLWYTSKHCIKH